MNNNNEVSTESHQPAPGTDPALSGKIFLDRQLPSLTIMGMLIVLIVVLSVLSGWKIVNLEQERTTLIANQVALAKDRTQFEKDIQTHSEILIQLPKLLNQQQGAEVKLVETEANVKAAEGRLVALVDKTNQVDEEYLILKNKITDAHLLLTTNQKKSEALQKEQAVLEQKNAEFSVNISNQQNRYEATKKDAVTEQKRLAELKDSITQYEKRLSELDAAIRKLTGSEAPLANLTEHLAGLKTQISDIVKDASVASKTLGTASQQVTSDASVLTASVNKANEATTAIQKVSGQIDGLSERFASRQKNLDQEMTTFTNTIDTITSVSNEKLTPAVSAMKERSDQFSEISKRLSSEQQTLSGYVGALTKTSETLITQCEKIKTVNDSLLSQQKEMADTIKLTNNAATVMQKSFGQIDGLSERFASRQKNLDQEMTTFTNTIDKITTASNDKLIPTANALKENTEFISNIVKRISIERQAISRDMEELSKSMETLKGMAEKIKSANDSLKLQQKDMAETVTKLELSISRIEKLPKELSNKNDSVLQAVEVFSSAAQEVKSTSEKLGVIINSLERNRKDFESTIKPISIQADQTAKPISAANPQTESSSADTQKQITKQQ